VWELTDVRSSKVGEVGGFKEKSEMVVDQRWTTNRGGQCKDVS
jgi:hypothetical protein